MNHIKQTVTKFFSNPTVKKAGAFAVLVGTEYAKGFANKKGQLAAESKAHSSKPASQPKQTI